MLTVNLESLAHGESDRGVKFKARGACEASQLHKVVALKKYRLAMLRSIKSIIPELR